VAHLQAKLREAVASTLEAWTVVHGTPVDRALAVLLGEAVPALVPGLAAEVETLRCGDGAVVSPAIQRALQEVGRACMGAVWKLQGRGALPPPEERTCCPHCGRRMTLVAAHRRRWVLGRFGRYALERPYYACKVCGGGLAPDDAAWGQGPGLLHPDLTQLLAANGCAESFQEAAETVRRHLGVSVDDNQAERTTEAIGLVALRRSEERAAAGLCPLPPDPGSDILLLEVDGGRVFAGGEWREPRLAALAPLGPEVEVDQDTGRERYCTGRARYTADIADADTFFRRDVRQLAEDGGLYHPRVHTLVCLSDGGGWIEPR
jgi:ribosomal protein S27AE